MIMYNYLMVLIKAAAKAANDSDGMTDLHLVLVYDHLMLLIEEAWNGKYLSNFQRRLLEEYLDRVWGGEDPDNGY